MALRLDDLVLKVGVLEGSMDNVVRVIDLGGDFRFDELVLLWSILCRRIVLKVVVVNVMLNDNCDVLPFSFPFSVFISAWLFEFCSEFKNTK